MATLARLGESLCKVCQQHLGMALQCRGMASKVSLTRYRRKFYTRQYPTLVVNPDGSTITVRYNAPRRIIMLPWDMDSLTEEEKAAIIKKRTTRKKIKVFEEYEEDFDVNKYSHLWKKTAVQ